MNLQTVNNINLSTKFFLFLVFLWTVFDLSTDQTSTDITSLLFFGVVLIGCNYVSCEYTVRQRLKYGYFPKPDVDASFIQRDEIVNKLAQILSPKKTEKTYYIICGAHGTGKTTAVLQACDKVKQGILYIRVEEDASLFPKLLA